MSNIERAPPTWLTPLTQSEFVAFKRSASSSQHFISIPVSLSAAFHVKWTHLLPTCKLQAAVAVVAAPRISGFPHWFDKWLHFARFLRGHKFAANPVDCATCDEFATQSVAMSTRIVCQLLRERGGNSLSWLMAQGIASFWELFHENRSLV